MVVESKHRVTWDVRIISFHKSVVVALYLRTYCNFEARNLLGCFIRERRN